MTDLSPNLSLPYLLPSQAQKHVTHNEALATLDALVQPVVKQQVLMAPPANPEEGECHLVPAGGAAGWGAQDHQIAIHDASGWRFITPRDGWRVYVLADRQSLVWDGSAWKTDPVKLDQMEGVGIGTGFDAVNKLSVSAPATLLSHSGAGHQLKLNKAAASDTASLLFQTGWSGRAEMGTTGGDDFAIKVSTDGAAWTTAMQFDGSSGLVSGAAVQNARNDITPGRLMRADYGYGPGNVLGSVSQAGGVPGGAVAERGSNANGEYMRLADGTQICQQEVTLSYSNAGLCAGQWNFPAGFAAGSKPQVVGTLNASQLSVTASGVASNQVTPLLLGGLGVTTAHLHVRTMPGASFSTGDLLRVRMIAVGRWF